MRYRNPSDKRSILGQVFTPQALAERLVRVLNVNGGKWLELGVGAGQLMKACFEFAMPEQFTGVEIDHDLIRRHTGRADMTLHCVDALDPIRLEHALTERQFEYSVGNPPFGETRLPPHAIERLHDLCPGLPGGQWSRMDLYFVLESLSRLKRPGAAAFIVGGPLIEAPALQTFRRALIDQASEVECLELPINTFPNAEVRSYLLVAKFSLGRSGCNVRVGRLEGTDFVMTKRIKVTGEQGAARLDLAFYEFSDVHLALKARSGITLEEMGGVVVRGSRSRNEFVALGIPSFHTTDFPGGRNEIAFRGACDNQFQLAEAGNILVPRVGSRCLNRQVMVSKGRRPYTEAVYRIAVPAKYRSKVFDWMRSPEGVSWRVMAARGACAKHLTVSTLLQMPVPN
ncbi:N-6 DNA methylase [Burkholderia orbicola]|uniref:N-6 DNA methylase n=1 Tax=Burkholderia orbicola TaxID=2978683 RepID=UPI003AF707C3